VAGQKMASAFSSESL